MPDAPSTPTTQATINFAKRKVNDTSFDAAANTSVEESPEDARHEEIKTMLSQLTEKLTGVDITTKATEAHVQQVEKRMSDL